MLKLCYSDRQGAAHTDYLPDYATLEKRLRQLARRGIRSTAYDTARRAEPIGRSQPTYEAGTKRRTLHWWLDTPTC